MSFNSVHSPGHLFSSTMTNHRGRISHPEFNVWIVVLTALFFFAVLGWFNFAISSYGTLFNNDHDDTTMNTLGFAIIWTLIAISIYFVMKWSGVLNNDSSLNANEHPLLLDEAGFI